MNRREMLHHSLAAAAVAGSAGSRLFAAVRADSKTPEFTLDLCPGRIGVRAGQEQTIEYAHTFGFQSVEPNGAYLAKLNSVQLEALQASLKEKKLVWGAGGMPVQFRADERAFQSGLKALPQIAAGLQRAGVTRVGTWLSPSHAELTYLANFKQHARRLKAVATVLADHDLRFGLEYVGPKTLWASNRHSFVHSMVETKELLDAIGADNVGFVLDSWHWYTAHESVADLRSLTNRDVVAVDLNDAPDGIEIDQQIDNRRTLPTDTGVIDLKAFLGALVEMGYDGPIRAEPFNKELNALDNEPAVKKTAEAMKRAFALVSSAGRA